MGFLHEAVVAARRGRGSVAPNPLVGAVIVKNGETLATGYHAQAGSVHAEVMALDGCRDPGGATLYVTLEPCRHQGKQPPCTLRIIRSGIRRVIIGALDPNPIASGGGVEELRTAGIHVEVRHDPDALRLIEDFSVWITLPRPYIALKMAATLNGKIASAAGVTQRLTSEEWHRALMELRSEFDAIMVGSGTLRVDDPRLTVRPAFPRKRPYRRIIVAGKGDIPTDRAVFASEKEYEQTIVIIPESETPRFASLRNYADVLEVRSCTEGVDLAAAMSALKTERRVYSVLCEGGPQLASSMLEGELVDRVYWAIAPIFLTGEGAADALRGAARAPEVRLNIDSVRRFGEDVMVSGRPHGRPHV